MLLCWKKNPVEVNRFERYVPGYDISLLYIPFRILTAKRLPGAFRAVANSRIFRPFHFKSGNYT